MVAAEVTAATKPAPTVDMAVGNACRHVRSSVLRPWIAAKMTQGHRRAISADSALRNETPRTVQVFPFGQRGRDPRCSDCWV
jgi:hypothetical protein